MPADLDASGDGHTSPPPSQPAQVHPITTSRSLLAWTPAWTPAAKTTAPRPADAAAATWPYIATQQAGAACGFVNNVFNSTDSSSSSNQRCVSPNPPLWSSKASKRSTIVYGNEDNFATIDYMVGRSVGCPRTVPVGEHPRMARGALG
jgi:hypothetical protein